MPKKLSKKQKNKKKKKEQAKRDSPALNVAIQILKRVCTQKLKLPAARAVDNARCLGNDRGCIDIYMPSKEQLDIKELTNEIEVAANAEVTANRPVIKFSISRGDAEKHYGETMYSRSDPQVGTNPTEILQLMWIDDCSLSVCSRAVLGNTAGVGSIKIVDILQKDRKGTCTLRVTFSLTGSEKGTDDTAIAGPAPTAYRISALNNHNTKVAQMNAKFEKIMERLKSRL